MASRRLMATSGDASSITGSSVHADIDHSEVRRKPASGATTAGTSSTAQNATAASLRSGAAGHTMSLTAGAVRPRREQHDDQRHRDIGEAPAR